MRVQTLRSAGGSGHISPTTLSPKEGPRAASIEPRNASIDNLVDNIKAGLAGFSNDDPAAAIASASNADPSLHYRDNARAEELQPLHMTYSSLQGAHVGLEPVVPMGLNPL